MNATKVLSLFLVLASLSAGQAALLFYEGFDYPAGEQLGSGLSTSERWQNHKSQFTITAGSLEMAGLKNPTGNRLRVAPTSASIDSVRTIAGTWGAQSSGALYVSFLLRIESSKGIDTAGSGTSLLTISKPVNNTQLLGVNLLNQGGIKLGVVKYPCTNAPVSTAFFSSGTGSNLAANATYLVIAKYEWVPGASNDVATVWLNPETLGHSEDAAHKVSTNLGADGTGPAGRLTLSRGAGIAIDEIRIGQIWADVTPTNNSPFMAEK